MPVSLLKKAYCTVSPCQLEPIPAVHLGGGGEGWGRGWGTGWGSGWGRG